MDTSVRWLNDYLDPPASAEEQAELLTRAGFPLEGSERVDAGGAPDVRQDFEMTSNRGDCVCHVGLAREIAAISGRALKIPQARPKATDRPASNSIEIINQDHIGCPLYTGRVIRGVKVGPSPDWLTQRLRVIGQIPRNNIVDATNFVLFELGQPTHVFDLSKLRGGKIIVRRAHSDEPFLPIGEGESEVKLTCDDLVIADAERAVAIGGVKGGALTAVTESTTDILIEAATFDRVTVRDSSRRHGIFSDSSYRYERGVHPAQVSSAADRLAALILELAGGEMEAGVVSDGAPIPEPRIASMRRSRCWKVLGVPVPDEQMLNALARLGFQPTLEDEVIHCTVPIHRLDIEREIDLIEEVGRMVGLDLIPIEESIAVRTEPLQRSETGRQAVATALVAEAFVETVTHSLIGDAAAELFITDSQQLMRVDDDRAGAEPVLRPSILPSLLHVRATNQAHGVTSLRLFENASTFWKEHGSHVERVRLTLLADVDDHGAPLRLMRGVVERLARLLLGPDVCVDVEPASCPWLQPAGTLRLNQEPIGTIGLVTDSIRSHFDVDSHLVAAELDLPQFYDRYPPDTSARALPTHPAIDRDISAIIEEKTPWRGVRDAVNALRLEHLEALEFVTAYRGKQIGAGRKSLTLRLRFRAPGRTLTHHEVDGQVEAAMSALVEHLGAEIRK